MMKKCLIILVMFCVLFSFGACGKEDDKNTSSNKTTEGNESKLSYNTKNPVAEITVKNYGKIVIELYPDIAPNTVNSFIYLIKTGFYDNNTIHRVQKNFVLQGGDPTASGTGGPGYSIKGEFSSNGFKNDLKHTEGVISMARSQSKNSAGSQFFIMLGTATSLDGDYAAFGKVVEGMDIIRKIESEAKVAEPQYCTLVTPLKIEKAVIDTKGKDYPDPEKLK
ncbi:MAG: peptidylprolyl isomerase [Clostridia bacterium]